MDLNMNFDQLSNSEKLQFYINNTAPVLNRKALFSDGTSEYRSPNEPMPYDSVVIRFRTAKENVESVYLITTESREKMTKIESDQIFDYYQTALQLEDEIMEYYFEINCGRLTCFYNSKGVSKDVQTYYNFFIKPGFETPDWAKGAVFYQIFVDRFCNGDKTNDVLDREYSYIGEATTRVTEWNKYPEAMGVREFYGGDLMGVINKLDYLQDLGVEAIYLNPIFVSPSNHKYDIQDYDYIDPHFGVIINDEGDLLSPGDNNNEHAGRYITRVTNKTNLEAGNELFIELVNEVHNVA